MDFVSFSMDFDGFFDGHEFSVYKVDRLPRDMGDVPLVKRRPTHLRGRYGSRAKCTFCCGFFSYNCPLLVFN